MPLINLIHEQRMLVRQREQQVRVLLLASVGVAAIAFLATGYFLFNIARYEVMSAGLMAKKKKIQPLLKELDQNKRDSQIMEPKLTTLTSATKATEQWYRILDHLTVNVPKDVWLTNVRCAPGTDVDGGISMSFQGYSLNHDKIGEFLLRLETCADLDSVTLRFSQERPVDKERALEFEIDAYLAGSKNSKKVKEKESA